MNPNKILVLSFQAADAGEAGLLSNILRRAMEEEKMIDGYSLSINPDGYTKMAFRGSGPISQTQSLRDAIQTDITTSSAYAKVFQNMILYKNIDEDQFNALVARYATLNLLEVDEKLSLSERLMHDKMSLETFYIALVVIGVASPRFAFETNVIAETSSCAEHGVYDYASWRSDVMNELTFYSYKKWVSCKMANQSVSENQKNRL